MMNNDLEKDTFDTDARNHYVQLLEVATEFSSLLSQHEIPVRSYRRFVLPLEPMDYIELPKNIRTYLCGDGSDEINIDFMSEKSDENVVMIRTSISISSSKKDGGEIIFTDPVIEPNATTSYKTFFAQTDPQLEPIDIGATSLHEVTRILLRAIPGTEPKEAEKIDVLNATHHAGLKEAMARYAYQAFESLQYENPLSRLTIGELEETNTVMPAFLIINLQDSPWRLEISTQTNFQMTIFEDDVEVYRPESQLLKEIILAIEAQIKMMKMQSDSIEISTDSLQIADPYEEVDSEKENN